MLNWSYSQCRPNSARGRYSLDLRQKVVTAYQLGFGSIRQLAEQFMLSPATVHSYIKQYRETQYLTPKKPGPQGKRKKKCAQV